MCNFNNQTQEAKEFLHLFMNKAAKEIGGVNFLLSLIEALRNKKPHPLTAKEKKVASNNTIITWNKTIFKDKLDLLELILLSHKEAQERDFNILNEHNHKKRKNIINMVKTLAPVTFVVVPQNPNDGEGFSFGVFDTINFEEQKVVLNPVFIALFFCNTEFTKKALKYTID